MFVALPAIMRWYVVYMQPEARQPDTKPAILARPEHGTAR